MGSYPNPKIRDSIMKITKLKLKCTHCKMMFLWDPNAFNPFELAYCPDCIDNWLATFEPKEGDIA